MKKLIAWDDGTAVFVGYETGDFIAEFPRASAEEVKILVERINQDAGG